MKRLLVIVALTMLSLPMWGQTTAVTATITDSDSQTWNNGTYTIRFVGVQGASSYATCSTGAAFNPQAYTGSMNGSGQLSVSIPDNSLICPAGTQWSFTLCANTSASCSPPISQVVSGATLNLSTQLSNSVVAPRFSAGVNQYGYADGEVSPVPTPGGFYWSVTLGSQRQWNGTAWITPSGGTGCTVSGAAGQLVFNNGSTGCSSSADWTITSHTLAGGASGIMDLSAIATFKLPGALATGIVGVTTGTGALNIYNAGATIPANFVPTLNQNTTGTAANLSGTPALPNGTTATTQSLADNTTKIATDAFVLANAGSGGTITSPNGTITVGGSTTIDIALAHPNTWTGAQTFVAPLLGTPASGVVTNLTGTGAFNTSGNAGTATNLASYPTLCAGSQFSQGLSSGSNNCSTPAGGGNVSTGGSQTAGFLTKWITTTSVGNSLADDGITTANTLTYTGTGGISSGGPVQSASDGVHAGLMALVGNTTAPTLLANNFHIIGPATATFTAWGIQFPNAENGSAGVLHVGAASSHISQATTSLIVAADVTANTLTSSQMNALVTGGSCGDTTHSCGITFDNAGRATAFSNNAISGGGGGVSSVGLSMPSFFTVTNSPVTTSGTLAAAYTAQPTTAFDVNSPTMEDFVNGRAWCGVAADTSGNPSSAQGVCNLSGNFTSPSGVSATTTAPFYGSAAGINGTSQGVVQRAGTASLYQMITNRTRGIAVEALIADSSAATLRVGAGIQNLTAASAAAFFSSASDVLQADVVATKSAYVMYSSTGVYTSGTDTTHWMMIVNDGTTQNSISTGVAFSANTPYRVRVWEDQTGAGCSSTTPCYCGSVGTQSAGTVTWSAQQCLHTNAPATGTQVNGFFGFTGIGAGGGNVLWNSLMTRFDAY